jgi:putative oxidoreductase
MLGAAEVAGGLTLAMGVGTPFAAGVIIAVLANAAWIVHRPQGLWNINGGYEYPLVLIGGALTVALTGPGCFSIDHLLGWNLSPVAGAALPRS